MRKTITKLVNNIPKFHVGQLLYAVSFSNDSVDHLNQAVKMDEWERDFARIHKVQVDTISIGSEGITYWLKQAKTGEEYGDSVEEQYISTDYNDLIKILINRWKL